MHKSNEQTKGPATAPNDPSKSAPPKTPFEVAFPDNYELHHREAVIIRDYVVPAALSRIVGDDRLSTKGAATYLLTFYPDGKTPSDPIEKALLEQLAIGHQRSIALNLRADKEPDALKLAVYNTAAVRLGAEVRRTALAIKAYRQPHSTKSFAVIGQQNIATGTAGQQNVYVDKSTTGTEDVSSAQTKPESDQNDDFTGGRFTTQREESATGGGRPVERRQTSAVE